MDNAIIEQNGNDVPTENIPFGVKKCGWVFQFIQQGWLKKRWRKRWCFLKHEALYLFEYETFDDSEDSKCELKLDHYDQCIAATKKESKKKFTFVLVPEKRRQDSTKKENKKKVHKEMICAENDAEMQSWIKAISETIKFTHMDAAGKEKALAPQRLKANLKPKGKKPPTRQHRRKRAAESQMLLESTTQVDTPKPEPQKRQSEGKRPASALMPKKVRKLSEDIGADISDSLTTTCDDIESTDGILSEADDSGNLGRSSTDTLSAYLQNTLHINDDVTTDLHDSNAVCKNQSDESTEDKRQTHTRPKEVLVLPAKAEKSSNANDLESVDTLSNSNLSSSDFQSNNSLDMDVDDIKDGKGLNVPDTVTASNTTDTENVKNENSNCNSDLIVEILEDVGFIRTEL